MVNNNEDGTDDSGDSSLADGEYIDTHGNRVMAGDNSEPIQEGDSFREMVDKNLDSRERKKTVNDDWSDDLREQVEDAKVAGWEVDEAFGDRVVMVDRDYGSLISHALIALLTLWWTFGIGNVLYALYNYYAAADKQVVRGHGNNPQR